MARDPNRADRLVKKQIMSLNRHIPRRRKTLSDLLSEERPHVLGSDGIRHRFKREELKRLASYLSNDEQKRLKLPIYIEMDTVLSGARISGKLESKVLCNVLELEECPKDEIFIYKPDMKIIRKKLPTATQYMFLVR